MPVDSDEIKREALKNFRGTQNEVLLMANALGLKTSERAGDFLNLNSAKPGYQRESFIADNLEKFQDFSQPSSYQSSGTISKYDKSYVGHGASATVFGISNPQTGEIIAVDRQVGIYGEARQVINGKAGPELFAGDNTTTLRPLEDGSFPYLTEVPTPAEVRELNARVKAHGYIPTEVTAQNARVIVRDNGQRVPVLVDQGALAQGGAVIPGVTRGLAALSNFTTIIPDKDVLAAQDELAVKVQAQLDSIPQRDVVRTPAESIKRVISALPETNGIASIDEYTIKGGINTNIEREFSRANPSDLSGKKVYQITFYGGGHITVPEDNIYHAMTALEERGFAAEYQQRRFAYAPNDDTHIPEDHKRKGELLEKLRTDAKAKSSALLATNNIDIPPSRPSSIAGMRTFEGLSDDQAKAIKTMVTEGAGYNVDDRQEISANRNGKLYNESREADGRTTIRVREDIARGARLYGPESAARSQMRPGFPSSLGAVKSGDSLSRTTFDNDGIPVETVDTPKPNAALEKQIKMYADAEQYTPDHLKEDSFTRQSNSNSPVVRADSPTERISPPQSKPAASVSNAPEIKLPTPRPSSQAGMITYEGLDRTQAAHIVNRHIAAGGSLNDKAQIQVGRGYDGKTVVRLNEDHAAKAELYQKPAASNHSPVINERPTDRVSLPQKSTSPSEPAPYVDNKPTERLPIAEASQSSAPVDKVREAVRVVNDEAHTKKAANATLELTSDNHKDYDSAYIENAKRAAEGKPVIPVEDNQVASRNSNQATHPVPEVKPVVVSPANGMPQGATVRAGDNLHRRVADPVTGMMEDPLQPATRNIPPAPATAASAPVPTAQISTQSPAVASHVRANITQSTSPLPTENHAAKAQLPSPPTHNEPAHTPSSPTPAPAVSAHAQALNNYANKGSAATGLIFGTQQLNEGIQNGDYVQAGLGGSSALVSGAAMLPQIADKFGGKLGVAGLAIGGAATIYETGKIIADDKLTTGEKVEKGSETFFGGVARLGANALTLGHAGNATDALRDGYIDGLDKQLDVYSSAYDMAVGNEKFDAGKLIEGQKAVLESNIETAKNIVKSTTVGQAVGVTIETAGVLSDATSDYQSLSEAKIDQSKTHDNTTGAPELYKGGYTNLGLTALNIRDELIHKRGMTKDQADSFLKDPANLKHEVTKHHESLEEKTGVWGKVRSNIGFAGHEDQQRARAEGALIEIDKYSSDYKEYEDKQKTQITPKPSNLTPEGQRPVYQPLAQNNANATHQETAKVQTSTMSPNIQPVAPAQTPPAILSAQQIPANPGVSSAPQSTVVTAPDISIKDPALAVLEREREKGHKIGLGGKAGTDGKSHPDGWSPVGSAPVVASANSSPSHTTGRA